MKALLIIDHGSKRNAANDMLFTVVKELQKKRPSLIVEGAHMELASPTIEEVIDVCVQKGATHITAHPYMLAPGRHATADIPNMVEEAMKKHPTIPYTLTPPLGVDDLLLDLILKRAAL